MERPKLGCGAKERRIIIYAGNVWNEVLAPFCTIVDNYLFYC
jgi:hypothetical protein